MKLQNIPPQEQALDETRILATALYEHFPEAARLALPYFTDRQIAIDETLLTVMIRFEVGRLLRANGLPVFDEEDAKGGNLSMENLALLGLAGAFGPYHFKILKSRDGFLPVPGHSHRKQAFYGQQLEFPFDNMELDINSLRPNVIFLWRFDKSWINVELFLSVPQEGGVTRSSVKEYYSVAIPHPVTTIRPAVQPSVQMPVEDPMVTVKESTTTTEVKG